MFGMTMPRLDAEGMANLLRSRGCDVPECKDDKEATAYFKKQAGGLKGGEHYLKVPSPLIEGQVVTRELRVHTGKEWIRQVTL